jgi:hypothetical protein
MSVRVSIGTIGGSVSVGVAVGVTTVGRSIGDLVGSLGDSHLELGKEVEDVIP